MAFSLAFVTSKTPNSSTNDNTLYLFSIVKYYFVMYFHFNNDDSDDVRDRTLSTDTSLLSELNYGHFLIFHV